MLGAGGNARSSKRVFLIDSEVMGSTSGKAAIRFGARLGIRQRIRRQREEGKFIDSGQHSDGGQHRRFEQIDQVLVVLQYFYAPFFSAFLLIFEREIMSRAQWVGKCCM